MKTQDRQGLIRTFEELRVFLHSTASLKNFQEILAISGTWTASSVVEWLQEEINSSILEESLYRQRCLKCLNTTVRKYHIFPSSFFLHGIRRDGDHPHGGGGFADVYRGFLGSRQVCLKLLRVHTERDVDKRNKMIENFYQEALIWTQLDHPNVLQLLGVNDELFPAHFCLVSPWMMNGDLMSFLMRHPDHDKMRIIREIIAGVEYLHTRSPSIVHGDIRGANILIDDDLCCRLADFGLSREAPISTLLESSTGGKGSLRWMAPEMFESTKNDPNADRSPRDIYAYASTILEIMTGKPPYSGLNDGLVIGQVVVMHTTPERPSEVWCPDHIWSLVEQCWERDPLKRPTATQIRSYLNGSGTLHPVRDYHSRIVSHRNKRPDTASSDPESTSMNMPLTEDDSLSPLVPQPALRRGGRSFNDLFTKFTSPSATPTVSTFNVGVHPPYSSEESRLKTTPRTEDDPLSSFVPQPALRRGGRSFNDLFTKSSSPSATLAVSTFNVGVHSPYSSEESTPKTTSPSSSLSQRSSPSGSRTRSRSSSIKNLFAKLKPVSRSRSASEPQQPPQTYNPFVNFPKPPPGETSKQRRLREEEARKVSEAIDEQLRLEAEITQENGKEGAKMLLFGQPGSGKTTVLKSLVKELRLSTWSNERSEWRNLIRLSLLRAVLDIVKYMMKSDTACIRLLITLHKPFEPPLYQEDLRREIDEPWNSNHPWTRRDLPFSYSRLDPAIDVATNGRWQTLGAMWKDDNVQSAIAKGKLRIPSSTEHFFMHKFRIDSDGYIPTDEDILHLDLPSHTLQERKISFDGGVVVRVIDLGGKQHWTRPLLENDQAIVIFVCSISDFDESLEDSGVNKLRDTIKAWRSLCSLDLTRAAARVVLMNKYDQLQRKLEKGVRISDYVTTYKGPNVASDFYEYLAGKFETFYHENAQNLQPLHVYRTTAIDSKNILVTLSQIAQKNVSKSHPRI